MPIALAIRLQRWGCKHAPFYRIVVAERRAPRDGRFVELLGNYNPRIDHAGLKNVRLNVDRLRYFIANGAHPSQPVMRILNKFNLLPPPPLKVHMPLRDVKPELLPRPMLPRQPLPQTRAERY